MRTRKLRDRLDGLTQVDEALDETFPASDPPSWMPVSETKIEDKTPGQKRRRWQFRSFIRAIAGFYRKSRSS